MADETQTPPAAEKQPEKVYEIGKGWVDKPADVEFVNPGFIPHKEIVIPPTTATEQPKTDPPPVVTPPSFNKEKFSKYGIEKEEDLITTLDSLDTLQKENGELKKKSEVPVFESETHQKLHDFLKPFPESSWQEMLKTGAEIVGMDPDAADGMKLLKEAYILNHPMIPRADAEFMFNQQEAKKYQLTKKKEDYENPEQYEIDKRSIDIQTSIEVDKARKTVKDVKAKLQSAPRQPEVNQPRTVPVETVASYTREIEKVLDGTTKGSGLSYLDKNFLRVKGEEAGAPILSIEFPEDKMKELRETALEHIKNPGIYDKSGKISNFDPAKDMLKLASALWPEWIFSQMVKQVDTLANTKRAEQIASVQPDKFEALQGKDVKNMSIDEQARELAKKEKEAREKNPQRR